MDAALRGVDISSQRAQRITPEGCQNFDCGLTMDEENYRTVAAPCRGNAAVRPSLDFATDSPKREVPDPCSGGPDAFEHVLDVVEEASEGLRDAIRQRSLSSRA